MIIFGVQLISYVLEKLHIFKPDYPDKERTCCVIPLNCRVPKVGETIAYMEGKGLKLVGTKLFHGAPLIDFASGDFLSFHYPTIALAFQGKDSSAMVYNYAKDTGRLCESYEISSATSSPMFCPADAEAGADGVDRLFCRRDLVDWTRSTDSWVIRENC